MSEVSDATQIVVAFGRGAYLLGGISVKAAVQLFKLINTIRLSKWKGKARLGRLRAIKGEDMMYLNAGTEDKASLKLIEKEMKQHGILFARMPDLCGGDGRTQYAVSVSDAPKVRALLIDHAMGPYKETYLGMLSEKDYLSTAFNRDGEITSEVRNLMQDREGVKTPEPEIRPEPGFERPDLQSRELQNTFEDVRIRMRDLDCQGLRNQYQWIPGKPIDVQKNFAVFRIDKDRSVFIPLSDAVLPGKGRNERSLGAALFRDRSYTVTNLQTATFQSLAGPVVMSIVKEAAASRTAGQQTVGTREVSRDQTLGQEKSPALSGLEGPTSALENLSGMLHSGSSKEIPSPFEKKL